MANGSNGPAAVRKRLKRRADGKRLKRGRDKRARPPLSARGGVFMMTATCNWEIGRTGTSHVDRQKSSPQEHAGPLAQRADARRAHPDAAKGRALDRRP